MPRSSSGFFGARRALVGALVVGVLLRLVLYLFVPEGPFSPDTDIYARLATNILGGHGFSVDTAAPFEPSLARAPAYTLFVALVWAIAGRSFVALGLAQLLLHLVAVYCVHDAARRRYGPEVGGLSALLYAALPFTAASAAAFIAEGFAMSLVAVALSLHVRAVDEPSRAPLLAAAQGVIWGVAMLARPYLAPLAAVAGVLLAFELRRSGAPLKRAMIAFVLVGVTSASTLAPWLIRNYSVSQKTGQPFVIFRHYRSVELYLRLHQPEFSSWLRSYDEPFLWSRWDQPPRANYLDEEERAEVAALFEYLAAHKGAHSDDTRLGFRQIRDARFEKAPLRLYVWRPISLGLKLWFSPRVSLIRFSRRGSASIERAPIWLTALFLGLNASLSLLALLGIFVRRRDGPFLWIWPAVLTGLLVALMARETRYVLPLFPIWCIAAAHGIRASTSAWTRRRGRPSAADRPSPAR